MPDLFNRICDASSSNGVPRCVNETSASWRRVLRVAVIATAAIAIVSPTISSAKSAFALGLSDNVANDGLSYGYGTGHTTRDEAEAAALDQCRTKASTDLQRNLCKIIDHFDDRCLAVAWDPKPGTPGFGWAIADTSSGARDQAISICRQSAGGDRAAYCVVDKSPCDGTGR